MTAIKDFFSENVKLPSPPAVALKILNAVRDEDTTFEDLAAIVTTDPVLTTRVLKIANSSLYGLPKQVTSIKQATSLIGIQALNNIALSFVIVQNFQEVPQEGFSIDQFWQRSISTAVAADILARETGNTSNDIFLTALLQDLGTLVLFLSDPVAFTSHLDNKRVMGYSIEEGEKKHFGFDHTEIGSFLLETWNFPDSITEPIRYHHSDTPEPDYLLQTRLLGVADKIGSIYHGTQSNRRSIEVHQLLSNHFNIEEEQVNTLIDQVGEKATEVMDLFQIEPGEIKPFSVIMQEANDELRRLNFSYEQVVLELKQAKQNAEELATNLKQANDKLRELAFRDDLTGLYNHRFFQEMLGSEIQRAIRYDHPLSLILLDIDYFKTVNDTFGHPIGDQVLKSVSSKMIELVRRCDIVARYGGEEFAVILPEVGVTGAKVLAQRLRRGVEQHSLDITGQQISVTISLGLAGTDMDSVDMSRTSLIAQSDLALYKAKQSGRNRVELAA